MGRTAGQCPVPGRSGSRTRVKRLDTGNFPQTMVIVKIPDSSHDSDKRK